MRARTDVVMFEIEDNVPPDEKPAARRNVIAALNDLDWGEKSLCVRINGLDTPFMYREVLLERSGGGARRHLDPGGPHGPQRGIG